MAETADALIGRHVRDLRRRCGLAASTAAIACNLSLPEYAQFERGEGRLSADRLLVLARVLDVDLQEIFAGLMPVIVPAVGHKSPSNLVH